MMGNGYLQFCNGMFSEKWLRLAYALKYGTNGSAMNFHETFSWREF
jgi:hypothetical protein